MQLFLSLLKAFAVSPGVVPSDDDPSRRDARGIDALAAKLAERMLKDQHKLIYN